MSNIRQTIRFYSMWSKEALQRVYYHTNGVEYIAFVTRGVWTTGHPQATPRVVSSLIGNPDLNIASRRVIAQTARRIRTGDYAWTLGRAA